ncbi:gastric inhibitory polypeptide receptor [Ornithorhynchus anatinus]|uniref:gastric inhibitory polypeptide receptor n=1 Tax=Ornithorhynchus anatinus TaxID=9258 RepID=UPI0010A8C958|nr:gastric inhibitory polypeptide receptor [Ornithorhynchus anatinus]
MEFFERWERYQTDCRRRMAEQPRPEGLVCNRTFDMYACWDDGTPNTTARAPCPPYLSWHQEVSSGWVLRRCGPDGQWEKDADGQDWRDHSQCENPKDLGHFESQKRILEHLQVAYTIGYSLSFAALLLALLLLGAFRRLRCTRNYIHMNLFASFLLRAASILTRDRLLRAPLGWELFGQSDQLQPLSEQVLVVCRLAQALTQYCVVTNYAWLSVEGLYLHSLLRLPAFSERSCFRRYLLLGWGFPVLFVVPWVMVRYLFENTLCWEQNEIKGFWWIIRTPILITNLINFCIFVRIVCLLLSKLQAHQMRCSDYKLRLARSTLTLLPLLGVHEVMIVTVIVEDKAQGTFRLTKLFFDLILSSFQGLFVSVLYCFINKEVQAEMRRKWGCCPRGVRSPLRPRRPPRNAPANAPAAPAPLCICPRASRGREESLPSGTQDTTLTLSLSASVSVSVSETYC